jgi:D-serine deaminase-like pyridoxal phosphate-dependent protein
LVLDIDVFEANLEKLHDAAAVAGKSVRPHVKAHKCPAIAHRQLQAGAAGLCAATISEVGLMLSAGFEDVLLCSPLAAPDKIEYVTNLAKRHPAIAVVADAPEQVGMWQSAASRAGVQLRMLVDLDLGDHRTGVPCGPRAIDLAEFVDRQSALEFSGLQAFSSSCTHVEQYEARRNRSREWIAAAVDVKRRLLEKGLNAQTLTGGSTGTWDIDLAIDGFTELQAGSYVFMDVAYLSIERASFGPALTVLATVVSANHPGRVTVDAGFKALATDRPFGPTVMGREGLAWQWAGDEFGILLGEPGAQLPRLGERIELIPPHCDPTVNLYDRIYVRRSGEIEDAWPLKRLRLTDPPFVAY